MTKLNQILAIEKGAKAGAEKTLTAAYRRLDKQPLLSGISRYYTPVDDEGEQLPSESSRVQVTAKDEISDVREALVDMFDVVAAKEWANTEAKADIVVDGQVLLANVPATYLLFLEKQLVNLHTFILSLPTLDPVAIWHYDDTKGVYTTNPVETTRTTKIPRNHVRAEATDKHPAQVDVYHEDVITGRWTTVKLSGALSAAVVREMADRVEKLQRAVKFAREAANTHEVEQREVGEQFLDFLFKPVLALPVE